MATDIIIVSYKDEPELKICVSSIEKYCTDYKLIIQDNNVNNLGFSAGVNACIKKSNSEWIWLLNSDAIVKNEMTQKALIERFSYSPKVGIVGSMQIDFLNHDLIRHSGTFRAFPSGAHSGGYLSMGHGQIPTKQKWVNFASVMIRRSIIPIVGLLDETMFLLYSDSSYCYSCRFAGLEVWYEPRSQVFHKLKVSKDPTEWHQKDMIAFMKKWGITTDGKGNFFYSEEFAKLDMFP